MKILSQAYGEDERSEFYSFVRSLEALKASMQGENKMCIRDSCNAERCGDSEIIPFSSRDSFTSESIKNRNFSD